MRQRTSAVRYIVIHCAASRPSLNVTVKMIDAWHRARPDMDGYGIGYHWLVKRDGSRVKGRDERYIGCHVANHNTNTIGVCLEGGVKETDFRRPEDNFTPIQKRMAAALVRDLLRRYPGATVLGHRDFPRVAKACPSFDAREWARQEGLPVAPSLRVPMKAGATSATFFAAGEGMDGAPDAVSSVLYPAQDTLMMLSAFSSWAAIGLTAVGLLIGAWAIYRGLRAAYAAWTDDAEKDAVGT